ncbi:MAG: ribosome recycling factor [Deltaproteobacteria bacterium]|nr:ribosome recycling factor [Deltaproteobacteria bacterium]MCL5792178.1 ribosome recycling factor [Deltaproteobacteria bacterium]
MEDKIIHETKEKMEKSIDVFRSELVRIRTGRASASIFDIVKVNYYGTLTPLNQIASITTPEPKQIIIQPWDANAIADIEKAILISDLGLTPINDGKIIRISIPSLTEERRKELTKITNKFAEDARISIRNIRRTSNDEIKKSEKEKKSTEDQVKVFQKRVQELTDEFIKKIDDLVEKKNKEIMEV